MWLTRRNLMIGRECVWASLSQVEVEAEERERPQQYRQECSHDRPHGGDMAQVVMRARGGEANNDIQQDQRRDEPPQGLPDDESEDHTSYDDARHADSLPAAACLETSDALASG